MTSPEPKQAPREAQPRPPENRPNGFPDWPSFWWLNGTQFCGALNDNLFKFLIVFCLIKLQGEAQADLIFAKAGLFFVTPFLLFMAASGVLADRVSKRSVVVAAKGLELVVMVFGVLAFWMGSAGFLYLVLFLMATQSTLFGPSKYGIVPELVGPAGLSRANSLLTALTYLAIIIGTGLAPFLADLSGERYALAALAAVGISILGVVFALPVRPTPAVGSRGRPSLFFFMDIARTLKQIRHDRYLLLAVLASAYFLMLGAYVQMNIVPFAIQDLALTKLQGGYLFLVAALGIGIGAVLCGRVSGRNIEMGTVPLGALGLTASAILLGMLPARLWSVCLLLFVLGVSAGLFIVPLNAFIQFKSPRAILGKVLAANSFLSFVGVLLASLVVMGFRALGLQAREGFFIVGCLTLVLAWVSFRVLPDFLVRFLILLLVRFSYRVRVRGAEHVPVEGPALLVVNHVSHIDAALIALTQQRRVRFLMSSKFYHKPFFHPAAKLMGAIPIAMDDSPKAILKALQTARQALRDGYLVCIFAEGTISRTGAMREFKHGLEAILKGVDAPVIPTYIGGAWGSIFSYAGGKLMARFPRRFPYPAAVHFGAPMPSTSTAFDVRQRVTELSCDYFLDKKPSRRPLQEQFVKTARMNWGRLAVNSTSGHSLTFGKMLVTALALAAALRERLRGQERIGIYMPPSVAGAAANLAVHFLGKVPVNLNYSSSADGVASAMDQAGIQAVLTSREFLEKASGRVPKPSHPVYLEDVRGGITTGMKVAALAKALVWPARALAGQPNFSADQPATIMFSSGTTGVPKGVQLSHHNVLSNIESFRYLIQPRREDNICAVLPFFHSFGYTVTFWLPLISGFSASYHPNPFEGAVIGKMARENRSTLLIATPTFLAAYARRAAPDDFRSVRLAVTGAEKLKPKLADLFEKRFGMRPTEGYGATECSPVISVNLPDVELDGIAQVGTKEGSVGQPVPGVAVRVVDPETFEDLGQDAEGLLLVKGPNVMTGYLNRPDLTDEVIRDGWYVTGDIARLDEAGFITLTDRLSRFSKIGGEMVPHNAVEEVFYLALHFEDRVLAVTSVPDEKKGERLVVVHTEAAGDVEALKGVMAEADLPNLWKPHPTAYCRIDEIPHLGSGKVDLQALRKLAADR